MAVAQLFGMQAEHLDALLRDQGGFELHIVLKRSGPLEAAFRDVATVTVLKPAHYLRGGSLMARMLQAGHNRLQLLRAFRQCCRARVLLSNTITNGRLLLNPTPVVS